MVLSAKVGGRSIIASGSICTRDDKEAIDLTVEDLFVHVEFEGTEENYDKADATLEVVGKTLKITLKNFENPLGTTFSGDIGVVNSRRLFVTVIVHRVGEKVRAKLL